MNDLDLERARELMTLARTSIIMSAMRKTEDDGHDWLKCDDPSCHMARSVVEEIDTFLAERH